MPMNPKNVRGLDVCTVAIVGTIETKVTCTLNVCLFKMLMHMLRTAAASARLQTLKCYSVLTKIFIKVLNVFV